MPFGGLKRMAATLTNEINYETILARAASYNRQLQLDKKSRLPFVDNATGIAQRPCLLQRKEVERYTSPLADKVFAYCPQKWKKTKRNFLAHSAVVRSVDQYNNNARAGKQSSNCCKTLHLRLVCIWWTVSTRCSLA